MGCGSSSAAAASPPESSPAAAYVVKTDAAEEDKGKATPGTETDTAGTSERAALRERLNNSARSSLSKRLTLPASGGQGTSALPLHLASTSGEGGIEGELSARRNSARNSRPGTPDRSGRRSSTST